MNEQMINQIEILINEIKYIGNDKYLQLPNDNKKYTGIEYSINDLKEIVTAVFQALERINSNFKSLRLLEKNTLKEFIKKLENIKNECNIVNHEKNMPASERCMISIPVFYDFLQYLRAIGIYPILFPSEKIIEYEVKIENNLNLAKNLLQQADESSKAIDNLIPNATASSMAAAIEERIKKLRYNVGILLTVFVLCIVILLYLSNRFLHCEISESKTQPKSEINDSKTQSKSEISDSNIQVNNQISENVKHSQNDMWYEFWLKRLVYLIPILYLLIFVLKQYNKERKLLEIYVHKKTIAQSLPAYIKQASDDKKDEILLRGSTMIFGLPENPDTPISGDGISISDVKELVKIGKGQ